MRVKFWKILIAALPALLPFLLSGAVDVPPLTGRVVDRAGVFGAAGMEKIENAILELEQASGGQMAVLTVKKLNGVPIEQFGIAVMDQWKIGHKGKDDGAILILAVEDREMRLEVGYGWEGNINDARAGDIIRGMVPFLRDGDYTKAAVYAVGEVQRFITGKAPQGHVQSRSEKGNDTGAFIVTIVIILLFLVFGRGRGMIFLGGFGGRGGGFGGGGGFSGGGGGGGGGGASGRW